MYVIHARSTVLSGSQWAHCSQMPLCYWTMIYSNNGFYFSLGRMSRYSRHGKISQWLGQLSQSCYSPEHGRPFQSHISPTIVISETDIHQRRLNSIIKMAPYIANQIKDLKNPQLSIPTLTTTESPTIVIRQETATVTVISDGGQSHGTNLEGGAIAGIVIGSIVGFVLICWILRSCFNIGSPARAIYDDNGEKDYHRHHRRRVPSHSVSSPQRVVVRDRSYSERRPSATYVYDDRYPDRGRRGSRRY